MPGQLTGRCLSHAAPRTLRAGPPKTRARQSVRFRPSSFLAQVGKGKEQMEVQGIVADSPGLPRPTATGRGNYGKLREAINRLTPETVLVIHNATHNQRSYLYAIALRAGK